MTTWDQNRETKKQGKLRNEGTEKQGELVPEERNNLPVGQGIITYPLSPQPFLLNPSPLTLFPIPYSPYS